MNSCIGIWWYPCRLSAGACAVAFVDAEDASGEATAAMQTTSEVQRGPQRRTSLKSTTRGPKWTCAVCGAGLCVCLCVCLLSEKCWWNNRETDIKKLLSSVSTRHKRQQRGIHTTLRLDTVHASSPPSEKPPPPYRQRRQPETTLVSSFTTSENNPSPQVQTSSTLKHLVFTPVIRPPCRLRLHTNLNSDSAF